MGAGEWRSPRGQQQQHQQHQISQRRLLFVALVLSTPTRPHRRRCLLSRLVPRIACMYAYSRLYLKPGVSLVLLELV